MTATPSHASTVSDAPTSAEIADRLRYDIIFGRLLPRERLVEEELCHRFGVKRYAVRNALEHLEQLELIERQPNRGASVKDLSTSEVDELYEVRAMLQKEAIARIPSAVFEDLADRLAAINKNFSAKLAQKDLEAVAALDDEFHMTLYGACGNRYLTEAINVHWQKTMCIHSYAFGRPSLSKDSVKDHENIIAAVRAGDRARATVLCNNHMQLSLKAYKKAKGDWHAGS